MVEGRKYEWTCILMVSLTCDFCGVKKMEKLNTEIVMSVAVCWIASSQAIASEKIMSIKHSKLIASM